MNRNQIKNKFLKYLDWYRNFHNYECSNPTTDEKIKNSKLKTDETGYQFHNKDVSELHQFALRLLWVRWELTYQDKTNVKQKYAEKKIRISNDIVDVATELFFEMTDKDIPDWYQGQSYLESLNKVKNFVIELNLKILKLVA